MGLVNHLGKLTRNITGSAECLRPLLNLWTADYDAAFEQVKKVLAHFDPAQKTVLQTDTSYHMVKDMFYHKRIRQEIGIL